MRPPCSSCSLTYQLMPHPAALQSLWELPDLVPLHAGSTLNLSLEVPAILACRTSDCCPDGYGCNCREATCLQQQRCRLQLLPTLLPCTLLPCRAGTWIQLCGQSLAIMSNILACRASGCCPDSYGCYRQSAVYWQCVQGATDSVAPSTPEGPASPPATPAATPPPTTPARTPVQTPPPTTPTARTPSPTLAQTPSPTAARTPSPTPPPTTTPRRTPVSQRRRGSYMCCAVMGRIPGPNPKALPCCTVALVAARTGSLLGLHGKMRACVWL